MRADAIELAEAIRSGRLCAVEAMEASLAKARQSSAIGAIAHMDDEKGRAAATAFDALPLHSRPRSSMKFGGVPTLAKDLGGPFAGLPVSAGSRLMPRRGGFVDSDLAERFRAAGFCLFGLTTVPEFGLSLASEPEIGPIARNPLDLKLSAGGSSGGAAAAVAAGIVAIAHATDAGGSIRVPAACCGLVGLKPGRGMMPAGPHYGNHLAGIATELVISRSVRDTATALAELSGDARGPFPPVASNHKDASNLKIGVLVETGREYPTDAERSEVVEHAAGFLEALGHALVPIGRSQVDAMAASSRRIFLDIVSVNLAEAISRFDLDASKTEQLTQAVIERGLAMSAQRLWQSLNAMALVSRDAYRLFAQVDVLISPILSSSPRPIGSFPTDHDDVETHFERMAMFAPLAALANISGFPAITLPFGQDRHGLPLPIQLMAPMGHEPLLLHLAALLEQDQRWQHRFPVAGLEV